MLPGLRHREFCNFLAISGPCRCRQKGTDMSDTTSLRPKAALGVGSIVGESFSILMRHFVKVMILAVIPTLLGYVSRPGRLRGDLTKRWGCDLCQSFMACIGVRLPRADCGNCVL